VRNPLSPNEPNTALKIEFDHSGANKNVLTALEQHARKATEPLRCHHHFPGRVSVRIDREQVHVVDGCCAPFVEEVRAVTRVILAQWRVLRQINSAS
jgi:hypothetical protein